MSKVISRLLWFRITTLCDWLTKLAPLSQPNGNPNQNQSCFGRTRFPALGASYMYLLRILIGSLCCLHLLRLAKVITLVWVLRHSVGNRSKSTLSYFIQYRIRSKTVRFSSYPRAARDQTFLAWFPDPAVSGTRYVATFGRSQSQSTHARNTSYIPRIVNCQPVRVQSFYRCVSGASTPETK